MDLDPAAPARSRNRPAVKPRRSPGGAFLKFLAIGVPLALVLVVISLFGARWWLERFLQGDDFRRFLDRKTSAALRAECHLDVLRWQGSEVYSSSLTATGDVQSPWSSLRAEEIRAQLNLGALWHRVWRVETLGLQKVDARLNARAQNQDRPAPARLAPENVAPPGAERHGIAGWLPSRVEFGEVRVCDLSFQWGGDARDAAGGIENVRIVAHPEGDADHWQIEGNGGRIRQGNFPPCDLEHFSVKANGHEVFVTEAKAHPAGGGDIEFSGKQGLDADETLDLALRFDRLPIEPFLPVDWRARLHGNASGTAHVTGSPDDPHGWHATGHVELQNGRVEALPVLDELALFTQTARFRQTVVQHGSADFDWTPQMLTVSNIDVEATGLAEVQGTFTVRGGIIDGQLELGVSIPMIHTLGAIGLSVFNQPPHDGYVWATVRLSGPANSPHEDLSGRLAVAVGHEVINTAGDGADALKNGAETVIDTATDLLNLMRPR